MRLTLALVAAIAICTPSLAESIPLAGEPFHPGDSLIEWKATNNLKALWVYKVIPQNLTSAVISNAMAVGSFKSLDMVKTEDKNVLRFQDHKKEESVTRYLEISPASGWIQYYDSSQPTDVAASVQGVPDSTQAERLALEMLFKLGIDRTQIASSPRPTGAMGISKVAPNGDEQFVGIQARHIGLIRQIDGIPFSGNGVTGGFWIEFGSKARIKQFELLWRNLVPYELRNVASDSQLLDLIKKGKAVHPVDVDVKAAKKFTVKSIAPEYLGALGSERQDFVYPVASLDVEAETGTNKVAFTLMCPLFSGDELHGRK